MATGATSGRCGAPVIPTLVGYSALVLATIVGFFVIQTYGETLVAPAPGPAESFVEPPARPVNTLLQVLVALAAVIAAGHALGRLFRYVGQPPVIGEVVAGILLGPSLLGAEASAWVLPPDAASYLGVIAQIGVILYMFLVGLELNGGLLKHRAHATIATSHASILIPFILGALLALSLYPRLSTRDVPFTSFALFMGVAMSSTAFPVLARILSDRRMTRTDLGVVALSCAATDDVTAWCLLALVVGVAKAHVSESLLVIAGAAVYIGFMLLVARPALRWAAARWEGGVFSPDRFALIFVTLLLSAIATEAIGIHAIFGAFLLGAVIPHDSAVAKACHRQLHHVVTILLLPAFFAFTGMRTRIDLLSGLNEWLICGVIIIVATIGKFGGTFLAARLTGLPARDAAVLGTLMNTRGLMELIVLNIALDLGVISPTLFAMMVIMALVTTVATSPVLLLLKPGMSPRPMPAQAKPAIN